MRNNLAGQTFGRWFVVAFVGVRKTHSEWLCRCECGTERIVQASRLLNGTTRSCGCWQKEHARTLYTIHGMWRSTEYRIWAGLVNRCSNPKNPDYPRYGARGITVCDRWRQAFQNFYADMGPRPSDKHSIDRIDNDGPYSPENCRWATSKMQTKNTRYNVHITFDSRTQTLGEWASELGMSVQTLRWRLSHWPIKRVMTEPLEVYHLKPRQPR